MKYMMLLSAALACAAVIVPDEANAVVCARGVYRAGCVGTTGVVAVGRPVVVAPVRPVVVAPVVVAPACALVNGVRVCR